MINEAFKDKNVPVPFDFHNVMHAEAEGDQFFRGYGKLWISARVLNNFKKVVADIRNYVNAGIVTHGLDFLKLEDVEYEANNEKIPAKLEFNRIDMGVRDSMAEHQLNWRMLKGNDNSAEVFKKHTKI